MKKNLVWLILLVTIVACGKSKDNNQTAPATKKSVKTVTIEKQQISAQIVGNGNFEPKNQVAQMAPGGEVVKVYHKNGDRVNAGELIIQLSDKNIVATYQTAKANFIATESEYNKTKNFSESEEMNQMESSKASMIRAKEALDKAKRGSNQDEIDIYKSNVVTAKKNYDQAKFNYDKNKSLYEDKLISEVTYMQYETSYIQAKSSLESAEKNLKILKQGADAEDIRSLEATYNQTKSSYNLAQKNVNAKIWKNSITSSESNYLVAKANYDVAKKNYDDLSVRAKITGVLSELNIKQYEKTMDTTVLFYILDDKNMEVNLGLNASEISEINMTSKVQLTIQELNKTFDGKIAEISPAADSATNKFMIKISIDNPDLLIKKGMYSKAVVYTVPKEMVVAPKQAVVIKGLYKYVFIVNGNNAKQVKVQTGNSNETLYEIISKDIKVGDKIIIEGQDLLEDNELIEEVK